VAGPDAQTSLVASKLAVLAVGVATAEEGHSFFDNSLPCPRRGVIDYRNTPRGREATFSGCDAGDGVVVDGTAEVRWTQPGADRSRISAIELAPGVPGAPGLTVRVADAAPAAAGPVAVTGITFSPPAPNTEPAVEWLDVAPVRVTAGGATTPLDERATPARVFRPALTIDALPNPAGSPDALTEADLKRVAYHGAMALASILLNETLEVQRGPHTHTEPCGTMRVTPDPATLLTRLDMAWSACEVGYGLFESGTFAVEWAEFDPRAGRLTMVVQGALTLGGGVPRTTLSRLEWTVSGLGTFPARARIAGRLVGGGRERAYAFELVVDD
jgi:hypothetical protein